MNLYCKLQRKQYSFDVRYVRWVRWVIRYRKRVTTNQTLYASPCCLSVVSSTLLSVSLLKVFIQRKSKHFCCCFFVGVVVCF